MMYYLVDTNVFIHAISNKIYPVAEKCKQSTKDLTITETILSELEPGFYTESSDPETREVYNCVNNMAKGTRGLKLIRLIKISDVAGAEEELQKIRKAYYGWMRRPDYLRELIDTGVLTEEDIHRKSFKKKDLGECELMAIAKMASNDYVIVTNDVGRVYAHPDQNLFELYAIPNGLTILSSTDWLSEIRYE